MNKLILSLAALLLGGLTASAIADVDAEGKLVYRDGVIRSLCRRLYTPLPV